MTPSGGFGGGRRPAPARGAASAAGRGSLRVALLVREEADLARDARRRRSRTAARRGRRRGRRGRARRSRRSRSRGEPATRRLRRAGSGHAAASGAPGASSAGRPSPSARRTRRRGTRRRRSRCRSRSSSSSGDSSSSSRSDAHSRARSHEAAPNQRVFASHTFSDDIGPEVRSAVLEAVHPGDALELEARPLGLALALAPRVRDRHGGEERLRVLVLRVRVDLLGRPDLDELALVHDRDLVGHRPHDGEVVRDEEVREPEVALEVLEQVEDLRLDGDVQRRDRLVADDQLRVQRERAGDADALALAARELVRVAVRVVRVEADDLEQAPARSPSRLLRVPMPCTSSGSATMSPTVMRGSSDEYGSWKTICMSCRIRRSSSPFSVRQLPPLEADRAARSAG